MNLKNFSKSILLIAAIELIALTAMAADDASTYLIMNDIPPYYRLTQAYEAYTHKLKTIPGYTIKRYPGALAGTDHFMPGHSDITYETSYQNDQLHLGMSVKVTQHAGSDSDKWLLHELEIVFQKPETLGAAYGTKNIFRDIDGNRVLYMWREYRWISNNMVVSIEAADIEGKKPEPLEVVQAYLQKYPSTIPSSLVFDAAHKIQWIKDEMERRLWLCDKCFASSKMDPKVAREEAVNSMSVFLDYREKYYAMSAADEKDLLSQYLDQNDSKNIQVKLTAYKTWWSTHKGDSITLP